MKENSCPKETFIQESILWTRVRIFFHLPRVRAPRTKIKPRARLNLLATVCPFLSLTWDRRLMAEGLSKGFQTSPEILSFV